MSELDPAIQSQLIETTLDLLGRPHRLRDEEMAKKYLASFRFVYCGLSAAVAKGESRAEGEPEECFHEI
jgi:hypothetical protein